MSESPESVPVSAKDFLGNPINAADTIIYPVRRGSHMWLNKLLVQAVRDTDNGIRVSGLNSAGRPVQIQNLTNVIVVTGILPENVLENPSEAN